MSLFILDTALCTRCLRCVAVCPRGIVAPVGEEGYPSVTENLERMCLGCGHCLAVCPEGAVTLSMMPVGDCPEIRAGVTPTREQVTQLLRSRRSIRSYRSDPVDRDTVQRLIGTARYAPTAANMQEVEWTVVDDAGKIRDIAGATIDWMRNVITRQPDSPYAAYIVPVVAGWKKGFDTILRGAPVLVTASSPRADTNGMVDISIALSYFELAALSEGLGTCWAGLLEAALANDESTRKTLGLPEGHASHYPMMLGVPKYGYARLPERKTPKIYWR